MSGKPTDAAAIGASVGAAFLWATYYLFILALPARDNLAIVFLAPIFGGAFALGWAVTFRPVARRELSSALRDPRTLGAGGLFLGFQVLAIVATRDVGAVNTALIVLASDVVGTPALFYVVWRAEGERFRRMAFWLGVMLIGFGAAFTIVAGGQPEPLSLLTLGLGVPLLFVNSALVVTVEGAIRRHAFLLVFGAALLAVCGPVALVLTPFTGVPAIWGPFAPSAYLDLFAMGVLDYALAPFLFFWAVKRISLVIPSVLQGAIPVFALAFVFLLGLQPVGALAGFGVAAAFVGSIAAARSLRPSYPPTAGPVG